MAPDVQCSVPGLQMPGCPVTQAPPPPGSISSVWPLQLLSRPSQTSADGGTIEKQSTCHIPPTNWQEMVPAEHTPGAPVEHIPPVPRTLSTTPSQSLSMPSQSSATGAAPTQASTPALHWYLPAEQAPG